MTDFSLDRIGDRLSGKNLTGQELILAEDDKVRVEWVMRQLDTEMGGRLLDIGASDGSLSRLAYERHGLTPHAIEPHPQHREALHAIAEIGWVTFQRAPFCFDSTERTYRFALLCEVMEHQDLESAQKYFLGWALALAETVVVTVPNRNAASFEASGRARWDWPDHKSHYTAEILELVAKAEGRRIDKLEPIVGTLEDSIWLGAVIDA
jgi:hypothetical protein